MTMSSLPRHRLLSCRRPETALNANSSQNFFFRSIESVAASPKSYDEIGGGRSSHQMMILSKKTCDSKSDSFQTDAAPFGSIRFLLTSKFPHLSKRQVGLVLTQGDVVALKGEPTSCKRAAAFKTEERVGLSNLVWI